MTNREKLRSQGIEWDAIDIAVVDGKPQLCLGTFCAECDFSYIEEGVSCADASKAWLDSEVSE